MCWGVKTLERVSLRCVGFHHEQCMYWRLGLCESGGLAALLPICYSLWFLRALGVGFAQLLISMPRLLEYYHCV